MSLRCFIAIELAKPIQRKLGALQKRLQQLPGMDDRAIHWVEPDNIHLTLKFLGDVPDQHINEVCREVTHVAQETTEFDFQIGQIGCFPPQGSARVLWVGVPAGEKLLQELQAALEERMSELGFTPEGRQFRPHLTLARIKNIAVGHRVREALEQIPPVEIGSQVATALTMFESVRDRTGPSYTVLHHADFENGKQD